MREASAPVVDSQVTELQTIMTNVVPAAARGILIILGEKPHEAGIPVLVVRFITNASLVQRQRQGRMLLLLRIINRHDAQQGILQHGLRIVVPEVHMHGMDIITFFVLYVETSVIQAQNGAPCIVTPV